MKKNLNLFAAAFAAILTLLAVFTMPARADENYRAAVTNTAGSASVLFTNTSTTAFSSWNADHLLIGATGTSGTTFTVQTVIGGITNTAASTAWTSATGERLLAISNAPALFAGDKLLITSSDTNTFYSKLYGRRR